MSGLARCISILRLYTVQQHAWTVQAMSEALATPASTIYRAVSDLTEAGLLEAGPESRYRLGAAFVEFDRLTRLTDPLLRSGRAVLHDTVAQACIPCVGLLSRLYNGTVMCVADEVNGSAEFRSSYERGRPMPLTRGATSQVILAHLPTRRLNRLLQGEDTPATFRATLADIRRRGFGITRGEIDPGLVGLATPVLAPRLGLIASLSLVVQGADLTEAGERSLVLMLVSAASFLADALERQGLLF